MFVFSRGDTDQTEIYFTVHSNERYADSCSILYLEPMIRVLLHEIIKEPIKLVKCTLFRFIEKLYDT